MGVLVTALALNSRQYRQLSAIYARGAAVAEEPVTAAKPA
jgi:hypothetical protein